MPRTTLRGVHDPFDSARTVPPAPGGATPTPRHPRPTRRRRPLAALLAALGLSLILGGCFSITGQTTSQTDGIGNLQITTTMCLQDGPGTCDNGTSYSSGPDSYQFLMAYLVPSWVVPADGIDWTGDAGTHRLQRDVSYENALQTFSPPPIGLRWSGYSTATALPPVTTGTASRMTARATLGIPDTAPGTLEYATVVGWRRIRTPDLALDRPYSCAEKDAGIYSTICILSGLPQQANSASEATTPGRTPTTDTMALATLALSAPTATAATAGTTAPLKFGAISQDNGTGTIVPITVSSTVPGATFDAPTVLILDRATGTVPVSVKIPTTTPSGAYTVTVRTTSGLRTATATLNVTGNTAAPAPKVTNIGQAAKLLATYLKTTPAGDIRRGNVFDLPVTAPGVGRVAAKLTRGSKTLATGTARARTASSVIIRLKPNPAGRKLLLAGSKLRGRLTLRFYGRKGVTTAPAFTVSLG